MRDDACFILPSGLEQFGVNGRFVPIVGAVGGRCIALGVDPRSEAGALRGEVADGHGRELTVIRDGAHEGCPDIMGNLVVGFDQGAGGSEDVFDTRQMESCEFGCLYEVLLDRGLSVFLRVVDDMAHAYPGHQEAHDEDKNG